MRKEALGALVVVTLLVALAVGMLLEQSASSAADATPADEHMGMMGGMGTPAAGGDMRQTMQQMMDQCIAMMKMMEMMGGMSGMMGGPMDGTTPTATPQS
jgi:hypothetical protein